MNFFLISFQSFMDEYHILALYWFLFVSKRCEKNKISYPKINSRNDPEDSEIFQNVPECYIMFQKVLECSRIIQKIIKDFRRIQNVLVGFKIFQKVPEQSRRFQNVLLCSERFENIPEKSKMIYKFCRMSQKVFSNYKIERNSQLKLPATLV